MRIRMALATALALFAAVAPAQALQIGDPAPPIKVSKWIKGTPTTDFEPGKVYIVEFWATWCAPCKANIPHLTAIAHKYKDRLSVNGISILERGENTLPKVEAFVTSEGDAMDYNVAADNTDRYMATSWLKASGERGIPASYIVDDRGRVAWIGYPMQLESALTRVLESKWDIDAAKSAREIKAKLSREDSDSIPRLNPFMSARNYPGALEEIKSIVTASPGLKYYPTIGHFTLYSLVQTDPARAMVYAREFLATNEIPPWHEVTDAVAAHPENLPKDLYALAADSYQAQIDNYPWSMDIPITYDKIANLQFRAANIPGAIAAEQKAIAATKATSPSSAQHLADFEANLQKYEQASGK